MKKTLVLSAVLAAGLLAACGGETSTSQKPAETTPASASASVSSEPEQVRPVYQIYASYEELYDQFGAFEFYGLLNSDGSGSLYKALVQNSGENKNLPQTEETPANIKYKVEEDEGIESLVASIDGTKFSGYKNKDGNFVLQNYKFPFAGGYSRTVDLIVSATIQYNDVDAWEAAVVEKYASRTVEVKVSETYQGAVLYADGEQAGQPFVINFGSYGQFPASAKWQLMSDFSVVAVYGVGGKNGGAEFAGTWTMNASMLHEVTIDGTKMTAVKEGEHETFTWNFAHQAKDAEGNPVGDPVNLTATLSWVDPNAQA